MQFMFKGKKRDGYLWLSILVITVFLSFLAWTHTTIFLAITTSVSLIFAIGYLTNVFIDKVLDK